MSSGRGETRGRRDELTPEVPAPGGPAGNRRGRWPSTRARLLWAGFTEVRRAYGLLTDPALAPFLPPAPPQPESPAPGELPPLDPAREQLVDELGRAADPDLALLALVRLAEACTVIGGDDGAQECLGAPARTLSTLLQGDGAAARVPTGGAQPVAAGEGPQDTDAARVAHLRRLVCVLGASQALGDFLVTHPEHLEALAPRHAWDAPEQPAPEAVLHDAVAAVLDGVPVPRVRRGC
ncbi:hypothetical protein [Actinomyces procaprae]|uniref:hypothetical protein n=1 Tax=Actinomyces procaprae TaxID=2560010 RepID=UPI0030842A04